MSSLDGPAIATQSAKSGGRYVGDLIVRVEDDGRHVVLVKPFEYDDADGMKWPVPVGTMSDGASIPQIFWSFIGGPLEGKYRNAAVIHDYYCDYRVREWEAVDRVFYDAMITSGVDRLKAKVMYAAVRWGGPHWDDQAIHNHKIPPPILPEHDTTKIGVAFTVTGSASPKGGNGTSATALEAIAYNAGVDRTTASVKAMVAGIRRRDPSLGEIDRIVDKELAAEKPRFLDAYVASLREHGVGPGAKSFDFATRTGDPVQAAASNKMVMVEPTKPQPQDRRGPM